MQLKYKLTATDIHGNVINSTTQDYEHTPVQVAEFLNANRMRKAVIAERSTFYFASIYDELDQIEDPNEREGEMKADLFDVPTEELVEELMKRNGVRTYKVDSYAHYQINKGSIGDKKSGPAIILEVID